jgi:fructose-1,6-bisphosphatase/inositol monophosphatase family enzyme
LSFCLLSCRRAGIPRRALAFLYGKAHASNDQYGRESRPPRRRRHQPRLVRPRSRDRDRKDHKDFVTDVDQAAEQAIIEVLSKAYPDHAFLGEESGASANAHDEAEYTWIIDPIDGTTNFMHGFPQYCISIALSQRGVITQSVVYDPSRNDLFTATKGAGAYLNEKRIRVGKLDRIATPCWPPATRPATRPR